MHAPKSSKELKDSISTLYQNHDQWNQLGQAALSDVQ